MPTPLTVKKSGPLKGRVVIPGDKSISHRALILGALAIGETKITGLLEASDILATAKALRRLGVPIEQQQDCWCVTGRGVGGLTEPDGDLDFGNSGTGARLMMGVVAGHDMAVRFTGDASLSHRPMDRVLAPLARMGLDRGDNGNDGQTLPLTLRGTSDLMPLDYPMPVASAQVKSAVLLAGLHAPGKTTVIERRPTRDHTERMLRHFGAEIKTTKTEAGLAVTVDGDAMLGGRKISVPGDPSSAAFFVAAALIVPGSEIVVPNILVNPTRAGFFETLAEMGAAIKFTHEREAAGENVADIHVKHGPLKAVTVPPERAPSMIDEYPVLAALAAYADGQTKMEGLGELRVKECDRLAATAAGLEAVGVDAEIIGDTLLVRGGAGVKGGGVVASRMDHRIAMAFLTLGLNADEPVRVDDTDMISTSFPNFSDLMAALGARFETG